jgi:carbamoyltransferase
MIILGLNGTGTHSHDASACVLDDGRILAYAEEERFIRKKHAYDVPPINAVTFCLNEIGLSLEQFDAVAFGWDEHTIKRRIGVRSAREVLEQVLPRALFPRKKDPEVIFVPHHLAHAASCFYFSGDDSAAIVIVDGQGEDESITTAVGRNGKIIPIGSHPIGWSLGYFYEAACQYVGMRSDDAGKLMGLAGYGVASECISDEFQGASGGFELRNFPASPDEDERADQSVIVTNWLNRFSEILPITANAREGSGRRDTFIYRDVAASAQLALEKAVNLVVDAALRESTERRLHLAGGVGYNATVNGKLLARADIDRLFVQPVAGDAGVSLGAAAWVAAESGDTVNPMNGSTSWGPSYSAASIEAELKQGGISYRESADIIDDVVDRLMAGEVVAWFSGHAEGGPRALGNRSLLALPSDVNTRDLINSSMKRREWWRPLAPSLTTEASETVFGKELSLPYMIITHPVVDRVRGMLSAVIHEDGTTRPQTVDSSNNPAYHELLRQIGFATGLPALLNTSFNRQEPIVCSPRDAIASVRSLGVKTLAMEGFLATF